MFHITKLFGQDCVISHNSRSLDSDPKAICKRPRMSSQVAESVIHPCRAADHQRCADLSLIQVPVMGRLAVLVVKMGAGFPFPPLVQCSAVVGLLGSPTPLSECYASTWKWRNMLETGVCAVKEIKPFSVRWKILLFKTFLRAMNRPMIEVASRLQLWKEIVIHWLQFKILF